MKINDLIQLRDIVGDWDRILHDVFEDRIVVSNLNRIDKLYQDKVVKIYPEQKDVFRAFYECPYDKFKVVVILQDPYHDGSATGLAPANRADKKPLSPSLRIVRDTVCRTVYKGRDFN